MGQTVSIAIETSCRLGGVALGVGDELAAAVDFDASARHAAQLVARLKELLAGAALRPADVGEVYVSVGPGSFTGTRIGVTVARTLAQTLPGSRCVAVSSPAAVAENARPLPWRHLAVVLDAREGLLHATLFERRGELILPVDAGGVMSPPELLARAPRPLTLLGEGLGYHDLRADGVTIPLADKTGAPPHLPTAEGVWRFGRRQARAGRFTDPAQLLPIYTRVPAALRARQAPRRH
jgi:tRNA threonylcarbamoyladenosine biosynthesis protein TsaB